MKIIFPIFCAAAAGLIFSSCPRCIHADEVYLKNGDRISGTVVSENGGSVVIDSEAMGKVSVDRLHVDHVVVGEAAPGAKAEEAKLWQGEIIAGYNRSDGNTQNGQLTTGLRVRRKTDDDEFDLRGDSYYSSSNERMDGQKWAGMMRYAFSFWDRKWYNFYKLEGDHDRFANIDYRLVPSAGIGYWFSDEPDWKMMVELAGGFEHTVFRDDIADSDEAVLIPRAFAEKLLFGRVRLSEDIVAYPSLTDTGEYRLRSETVLTSPISDALLLRVSFIDDYNSDAPKDTKKNDILTTTSLVYSF